MGRRVPVLLVAAALLTCADALAQSVRTGCRVRVQAPAVVPGRIEGRVHSVGPDTLVLEGTQMLALPVSAITDIRIYRGTRGHAGTGALIGAGVLGAAGLVAGFSLQSSQTCLIDIGFGSGKCEYSTGEVLAFAGISAAIGAGLGAIVGALVRTDRWDDVPVRSLRVEPSPGAVTVSVVLPVGKRPRGEKRG